MCVVTILARPITGVRSEHGEGPVYDPLTDELLWVDIPAGLVNVGRLGPAFEHVRSYAAGDVVSAVVPRRDPADGWVVASRHGFSALDRSGVVTAIAEPEHTADRMNDGKCDPFGGFWAGSMGPEGAASLYRLAPDGTCRTALTGVTTSNGLAWRDPEHVYYIDTPTRRVDVFDHADGTLTNRRTAFPLADGPGSPDGLTVDAEGCVWVALYGGAAVHRYAPDGELLAVVPLPVEKVTACTFGGPDLDRLYITTSRENLDAGGIAAQPLAGALFAVDAPGVRGLPALEFAG